MTPSKKCSRCAQSAGYAGGCRQTRGVQICMKTLLLSVNVLLVVAFASAQCKNPRPHYKVAPDFTVKASFGTTPLKGGDVRIMQFTSASSDEVANTIVASTVTDDHGEAVFARVKPGRYFLSALGAGLESGAELSVTKGQGSLASTVSLSWPEADFELTQRIGGRFTSYSFEHVGTKRSDWSTRHKVPFLGLVLVTKFGDSDVAETVTDENGYFDFPSLSPGYYVINVRGDTKTWHPHWVPMGYLLVHLDREAKRQDLTAFLSETDCGLIAQFDSDPIH